MINHVFELPGKDSRRTLEKCLGEKKENKKMEGFNESDQTLRSMVMFKQKKIKATYLRKHKGNLIGLRNLLMLLIGKLK